MRVERSTASQVRDRLKALKRKRFDEGGGSKTLTVEEYERRLEALQEEEERRRQQQREEKRRRCVGLGSWAAWGRAGATR